MRTWLILTIAVLTAAVAGLQATGYVDLRTGHFDWQGIERAGGETIRTAKDALSDLTEDKAEAAVAKSSTKGASSLAPAVTVANAAQRTFVERLMVTGTLVAREEILIAPEVNGLRVVGLKADVGDLVEKGDVLATLEQETLKVELARNEATLKRADAGIAQAESRVAEAEAVLEEAQSQLDRARPLQKRKILSDAVFDQRRAAATSARAQLSTARDGIAVAKAEKAELEAQRRDIQWRLSKTEIRAPSGGLVTKRTARVGGLAAAAGEPLFEIARDAEIEFAAEVTEPKLASMRSGQKAVVSVAGAGDVDGVVRLISPQIDPKTRLGEVRIFLGANPALRIGAFGRALVRTSESSGLAIPLSAVLYDDGKPFVQRVDGGKVHSTAVETGLADDGQIEIRKGLEAGTKVVAKAGTFLRDGDAVRPIEPANDADDGDARRLSEATK